MRIARRAGLGEELLVLLSGGASALMALPAGGVTLEDKRRTTELLLRAGADIHALNTVRKHLSGIKGGWLAAATSASCWTLAVSDVVGDDLSVIGSGPTVADATTFLAAREVLARYGGLNAYPASVVGRVRAGVADGAAETPKPGDPRLARSRAEVIGSRYDAMRGAADEARARGFHVLVVERPIVGEARVAARSHLEEVARAAARQARPLCVVSSGETTVAVHGTGRGGRNQEFALAAADALLPLSATAALASVGTDGIDGPTDAAGALVDSATTTRARHAGLVPEAFLADNNAYEFFQRVGDLIHTGPTNTNVGDLQVLLLA
jgi:hydroxypyruvate reductase